MICYQLPSPMVSASGGRYTFCGSTVKPSSSGQAGIPAAKAMIPAPCLLRFR